MVIGIYNLDIWTKKRRPTASEGDMGENEASKKNDKWSDRHRRRTEKALCHKNPERRNDEHYKICQEG